MRQSVIGNAGTLIVFRIGAEDAPLLARELGTDAPALTGVSNFQAFVKQSDARLVDISPPGKPLGSIEAILRRARSRRA